MPDDSDPPRKIDPSALRVPGVRRSPEEPHREPDTQEAFPTEPESQEPAAKPAVAAPPTEASRPTAAKNPLRQFSLLGRADEIEASAADTKPLLGELVMRGQATMIYAEPNTGKTLIVLNLCLDAMAAGRIDPNNLFYINADDSSEGLAVKLRLMQDAGAHMLAPGQRGLRTADLVKSLSEARDAGSARGTCVVIDTLKKFTDLMDKKRTSEFADVCRQYVMAGGTIVALGHTAKNPNADGTPRYQGTTDILEDFDAVYVAQPLTPRDAGKKVVKFTKKKGRADSAQTIAYSYDIDPGMSYVAKLASVQSIDPDKLDDYAAEKEDVCEGLVMEAIVKLIQAGSTGGKMALASAAAKKCGISRRAAIEVLERYTGTDPREHLWTFRRGKHGVQMYERLQRN